MISYHFWFDMMFFVQGGVVICIVFVYNKNICINVIGHDNLQKVKLLGSSG